MKVLFTATVVKTHIMEFHLPYLRLFKEHRWETAVAAKNDFDDPLDCVIPHCDTYYDVQFERNPLNLKNLKAYRQLKKIIDAGNYDIIHCHTPVGGLLTRLAAAKARKKGTKVFYTAHGFHFFKGAPLLNWLVYYPVERMLSRFTDVLITITEEDFKRAQKFKAARVEYVPGVGIDAEKFCSTAKEKATVRLALRQQLGIPEDATVLLSVGEVNTNKNHKAVIECLPQLENMWYVVCGRGPLMDQHCALAQRLGVRERLIMAGYRTDVADFYKMADVFVFPSMREGLPVALMEALASGLPVVCTRIRGSSELVKEGETGFFVDAKDKNEMTTAIKAALKMDLNCSLSSTYHMTTIVSKVGALYGLEEFKA